MTTSPDRSGRPGGSRNDPFHTSIGGGPGGYDGPMNETTRAEMR